MSNAFSSFLQLTDLNDYIQPAQECTRPEIKNIAASKNVAVHSSNNLSDRSSNVVKISLADCLACSGCITSAETVLIEQQNGAQFMSDLKINSELPNEHRKIVVASIAPQCYATLDAVDSPAEMSSHSILDTRMRVCTLLHRLGVHYVFDLDIAHALALRLMAEELCSRVKTAATLPLLCSECPGFVCFAEKSHGTWLLPHLSRVKSAQQISGILLKNLWANQCLNVSAERVYHVTVMPCFDKKLEAVTRQHSVDQQSLATSPCLIDCVITPRELGQLLRVKGYTSWNDVPLIHGPDLMEFSSDSTAPEVLSGVDCLQLPLGSASGGMALYVMRSLCIQLTGRDPGNVEFAPISGQKSRQIFEAEFSDSTGKPFKFAVVNGFRGLQNLVRRIRSGRGCDYVYVEMMACPDGGCINGGALHDRGAISHSAAITTRLWSDVVRGVSRVYTEFMPDNWSSRLDCCEHLLEDYAAENADVFGREFYPVNSDTVSLSITW